MAALLKSRPSTCCSLSMCRGLRHPLGIEGLPQRALRRSGRQFQPVRQLSAAPLEMDHYQIHK